AVFRDALHRQEPQVVRRELVFDSGISETDYEFHDRFLYVKERLLVASRELRTASDRGARDSKLGTRNYFSFFSFLLSLASGAAGSAPSSSVSCLPFLMTSGSAGV